MRMAKKRPKAGRPQREGRATAHAIRTSDEWWQWIEAYAESLGLPVTSLIVLAVTNQAKRDGFEQPPPRL